jgi:hypothetical protein
MKLDSKVITGLAGTLLLGVCSWLLSATLQIQQDIVEVKVRTENIKETLDKVYADNCPYCIHAAHSSIAEHPLLSPAIKQAHKHLRDGSVELVN